MNAVRTGWGMALAAVLTAGSLVAQEPGMPPPRPEEDGPALRGPGGAFMPGAARDLGMRREEGREVLLMMVLNNPQAAKEAGVTEEQIAGLKSGIYEIRKERVRLNAELEVAAMEQGRLLEQENVDEAALMAAVEKKGQLKIQMDKLLAREMLLVKKTLKKEQVEKIRQMGQKQVHRMAKERERRLERGGKGNGNECGPRPGKDGDRGGNPPPQEPPPPPPGE